MIGSVRYCKTNNDFYLVQKKENDREYKVCWLKIGCSLDDIDDILQDEEIYHIDSSLAKKIEPFHFLKLIKTAYNPNKE